MFITDGSSMHTLADTHAFLLRQADLLLIFNLWVGFVVKDNSYQALRSI